MTGLNAEKFATFWMFPKRFYHSFVLQITLGNFDLKFGQLFGRAEDWVHVNQKKNGGSKGT